MRYLSILGVLCGALALIFQLAGVAVNAEPILVAAGVILVGVGNLTGL